MLVPVWQRLMFQAYRHECAKPVIWHRCACQYQIWRSSYGFVRREDTLGRVRCLGGGEERKRKEDETSDKAGIGSERHAYF